MPPRWSLEPVELSLTHRVQCRDLNVNVHDRLMGLNAWFQLLGKDIEILESGALLEEESHWGEAGLEVLCSDLTSCYLSLSLFPDFDAM